MEIFKDNKEKQKWEENTKRIQKWCIDCVHKNEGWLGDPCHDCLGCDYPPNAESYIPIHYKEAK